MPIENQHHSGFNPEMNVIEKDGDIKPYVAPLEPPDNLKNLPKPPKGLPSEVRDILHEAALKEDILRQKGARKERISRIAHIPATKALARLGLQKIDITLAFPPDHEQQFPDDFTDAEEKQIDILMNGAGMNRAEAEQRVKARR